MGVTDKYFMELALAQAQLAYNIAEVPVGAILVIDKKIIASSHNKSITTNNPTAHAEIEVLRLAGKKLNNYRLIGSTIFITLEPCIMCFGALVNARVNRIVYGATDSKTGACGGCINMINNNCFNHKIKVNANVLAKQSTTLLQSFFTNLRNNKLVGN